MREGLGSGEADSRLERTDLGFMVSPCEGLAPIDHVDPDLNSSSAGFSMNKVDAIHDLAPVGFEALGCEEARGPTTVSAVPSDGAASEKMEADVLVLLLEEVVTDGVPEKRGVDGEELEEIAVGPDVLPTPCSPRTEDVDLWRMQWVSTLFYQIPVYRLWARRS
ncbi:hypothetical protein Dimus_001138 [Dionaea muscipula]